MLRKMRGRFNKRLVPRNALKEITQAIGQARRDHEFLTLPWGDNGSRLLPGATYMEHTNLMKQRKQEFEAAVARFVDGFENLVRSQGRLGTLLKIGDYPGMIEEGGRLRFVRPQDSAPGSCSTRKSLRFTTPTTFGLQLVTRSESESSARSRSRSRLPFWSRYSTISWQRLYKAVAHMSERMNEYNAAEEGNRPKLYTSMVTNIVDIVDVLPSLNIASDADLNRMAEEVRQALVVDTKQLRKSESLRNEAAQKATEIAQRMAAYMGMPAAGPTTLGPGTKPDVTHKLTRARTQLLLSHPFFGALCLRLKLFPAAISTMATDGRRIAYGPKFVASLTPAELEGVLAHEVMHCALAHHCRRGTRDLKLWNQAADYAINYLLVANGFTLPQPRRCSIPPSIISARRKSTRACCSPLTRVLRTVRIGKHHRAAVGPVLRLLPNPDHRVARHTSPAQKVMSSVAEPTATIPVISAQ